TGLRQAGNKPAPQRIAGGRHDDWDGRGGSLGRKRRERSDCHNDVDVEANQLGRELGQPFESVLRPAALEGDVFPFDPSQLRQGIEKGGDAGRGTGAEIADRAHLRGLPRPHCQRPSHRRTTEQRDERAPLHSITSSARASSNGGISRPSALAVLRLMNSSNLVGCSTGRSTGLVPRRILSAYSAARRYMVEKFTP